MMLTLHVGLPKTMTTSLQSIFWRIWPELDVVSGRYLCDNIYFKSGPEMGYRDWTSRSCQSDMRKFAKKVQAKGNYLLSNENFSQWRTVEGAPWPLIDGGHKRHGKPPIVSFLSVLRESLAKRAIALKVVIGLRERATFLAALYCELAHVFPNPGQADFYERALRFDPFLKFEENTLSIMECVGPENLFVWRFEHDPRDNLNSLGKFLSTELPPALPLLNKRSVQDGIWEIPGPVRGNFLKLSYSLRREIEVLYQGDQGVRSEKF